MVYTDSGRPHPRLIETDINDGYSETNDILTLDAHHVFTS